MKPVSCRTVKKFRLLLLDANVVIEMARHRLWGQVIGLVRYILRGGLSCEFTRQYRVEWTKKGFQEGLRGMSI